MWIVTDFSHKAHHIIILAHIIVLIVSWINYFMIHIVHFLKFDCFSGGLNHFLRFFYHDFSLWKFINIFNNLQLNLTLFNLFIKNQWIIAFLFTFTKGMPRRISFSHCRNSGHFWAFWPKPRFNLRILPNLWRFFNFIIIRATILDIWEFSTVWILLFSEGILVGKTGV
jgi:hypothetical protein